ncbi:MAG: acetoacetate decarboxylase family protein [Nocardioidaceae bacterium]|nr:MAG: acetoacetate decarboxylase family protein [Nocardioidaceae bacterium]
MNTVISKWSSETVVAGRGIRRMPVGFGPTIGPRQGPEGRDFNGTWSKNTTLSVTYFSDPEAIGRLLPPGFEPSPDGRVTVQALYNTDFAWLAGRGYNWVEVLFGATYRGVEDVVAGDFVVVMWESIPDPVLPGREELGLPKMFAEIPAWEVSDGTTKVRASWDGFEFCAMTLEGLELSPWDLAAEATATPSRGGLTVGGGPRMYYKYIPRTGAWHEADAAYATCSPAANYDVKVIDSWQGAGAVEFTPATWEQLPTLSHIVNPLAELPVLHSGEARMSRVLLAFNDLADQRILR